MKRFLLFVAILLLGAGVNAQSKIKSFKQVSLFMDMNPSSVKTILEYQGYETNGEKLVDGTKMSYYLNKDLELFHPWYDNYHDEYTLAVKDDKMMAVVFFIGQTEDEDDVADVAYRQFQKSMEDNGYILIKTEPGDDGDMIRHFINTETNLFVAAELYMEQGDVVAAEIYMYRDGFLIK